MTQVDEVLKQRLKRYGYFDEHSKVTQELKAVINGELLKRGKVLDDDMQEALDMICHKIGRIVNGDPDYDDNWIDIAGYATLVANRLNGTGIYAPTT